MKFFLPLLVSAFLFPSCASDKASGQKQETGFKSMSQRMEESNGFTVDSDGNWKPKSDKRSSFESQGENAFFKSKDVPKTEYRAGEYTKKSWWGTKDFGRNPYRGKTDASRFHTTSRYQSAGAREAGTGARLPSPYQTGVYATNSANETNRGAIARTADAETQYRRAVFDVPAEVDYRAVRSLSIEQSKGILGR